MDSANRKRSSPVLVEPFPRSPTTISQSTAPPASAHLWHRLPGVFRRWEFEEVIDDHKEFRVEPAGHDQDGMDLFAIFNRPLPANEGTP